LVLAPVAPPAAAVLGAAEALWLSWLTAAVEFFARLPWAHARVGREAWTAALVLLFMLPPLLLDPGPRWMQGYFAWTISRISAANASPSSMKRSIARLATFKGRSERRW